MSLAEIKNAVDTLSPAELTELASFIRQRENDAWGDEIARDFSPGGKQAASLNKIDAEIDAGSFTPSP